MLGAAISLSCLVAAIAVFLCIAEKIVSIQNRDAIVIEKLHPASYRKMVNRFKQIKEDFTFKKYLYEKKELTTLKKEKKNRRPHIKSRYKEDEFNEVEESKITESVKNSRKNSQIELP